MAGSDITFPWSRELIPLIWLLPFSCLVSYTYVSPDIEALGELVGFLFPRLHLSSVFWHYYVYVYVKSGRTGNDTHSHFPLVETKLGLIFAKQLGGLECLFKYHFVSCLIKSLCFIAVARASGRLLGEVRR